MINNKMLICSFCGKDQNSIEQMIVGSKGYICNECVNLCASTLKSEINIDNRKIDVLTNIPSSIEIKNFLDKYIIGQNKAKKIISVAVHNHYKKIFNPIVDNVELEKSNVILVGPTGVGKTLLIKTVAKFLKVPIVLTDATDLTESGYVGEDIESILHRLLQNADYNISKAEHGIVYVDEIDKKSKKSTNLSITRDVSGEGVQQGLLKLVEGCTCRVPVHNNRKHPRQEMIEINTDKILFIVGGAFIGLDEIINKRLQGGSNIGFNAKLTNKKTDNLLNDIQHKDLIKYGMIPEFIGRFPVLATFNELTESELIKILTIPQNAILKQFEKLFQLNELELVFEPETFKSIVNLTVDMELGARGLRSIIENKLLDLQYNISNLKKDNIKKIIIKKDFIENDKSPIFIK